MTPVRAIIIGGLTALVLCLVAYAAFAQDAVTLVGPEYVLDQGAFDAVAKTLPEFVLKAIPFMLAAMVIFRGLADALLLIANRLNHDGVGKAASLVGRVAEVFGRVLGYVGIGMPRPMLMAKAEKVALKEMSGGEGKALGNPGAGGDKAP